MEKSDTLLLDAARKGDIKKVRKLLEQGADVDAKDIDGLTALHEAAENKHTDVVKVLLQAGADANIRDRKWYAWTPLDKAVMNGCVDIVKVLLEAGADVNAKHGEHNLTVLMMAALSGHTETVAALLDAGADVNTSRTDGDTALHWAAMTGQAETVRLLLENNASINAKNTSGEMPLQMAAAADHTEVVSLLREHENMASGNSDMKLSVGKCERKTCGARRMMNWVSKIFRRSASPSGAGNSNMADVIADRKKLLAKHIKIQVDKAKSHSQLVPGEYVRCCRRLFANNLDDMAEKVVRSELCGDLQNHAYRDTKSGVYMVVSVLPWTTEEAVCKLSEMSDEKPFGYVSMMTNIFINNWPKGLDPDVFSSLDLSDLLRRIREYQTMACPLRTPFFTPDDNSRPNYQMVDGKIGRASTFIDMIFIEVVPANVKKQFKPNESVEPGQVVWKLILHYAEFPLARLIFLLPFMHSASEAAKKGDKAVIMVIQDTLIQIYKGVENLLFDVYSDLPEGAVLSDTEVVKKLRSLLAA